MPDLEDRVAHLESQLQELRHLAETGAPAGVAFGLSYVGHEVAELRRETQAGFESVRAEMAAGFTAAFEGREESREEMAGKLARVEAMLQTLLER